MKLISVALYCRNEVENVEALAEEIILQFTEFLPTYNYEIIFADNASTDGTREKLRTMCKKNPKIRAIFNANNFSGSGYHAMLQSSGDCCISMASDFQDPPELIPRLVKEWETGGKIICAIKTVSKENKAKWYLRSFFYWILKKYSTVEPIPHFTGSGLYDRDILEIFRRLGDTTPVLRTLVPEYGYEIRKIFFSQPQRRAGKSKHNLYTLFNAAMRMLTTHTQIGLRIATVGGMLISILSAIVGLVYLIMKLTNWSKMPMGIAPLLIGVFFLGSIQIFFIGLVGEYIMVMNKRLINQPYSVEAERINFDHEEYPDRVVREKDWDFYKRNEK